MINMANKDRSMMATCTSDRTKLLFADFHCDHPLDSEIVHEINELNKLMRDNDDDYEIFRHRAQTDVLWRLLIEKAIKCLRYYDDREPFMNSEGKKTPKAYGIDQLKKYYDKYSEFERILYGSNQYYRDHVIHVFRTWLSGVELLTKNEGVYLDHITLHEKGNTINLNRVEKLSVWTLIALTHDLGYPLQKAKSIIDTTRSMVSTFITNPDISIDFSFHGVQNYMNDFIVRLMSSKMKKRGEDENGKPVYVARLQPKYYFKFQKSLERNDHGILSILIIYKLLTYFLESDYNINEDYTFDNEECRQFYIRREILRAIAAHTCDDVYQLYMTSFSFLLRICDDTQEWGRKNISELYVKSSQEYKIEDIDLYIDPNVNLYIEPNVDANGKEPRRTIEHRCTIKEEISLTDETDAVVKLIERFREQSLIYVTIFRDGQDTVLRDFSFERRVMIKYNDISITLTLQIAKDNASALTGEIKYTSTGTVNDAIGKKFFSSVKHLDPIAGWEVFGTDENNADKTRPATWRRGKFAIALSS